MSAEGLEAQCAAVIVLQNSSRATNWAWIGDKAGRVQRSKMRAGKLGPAGEVRSGLFFRVDMMSL